MSFTFLSFFCPFWDFPDFSGIFPICSGIVRGFSRFAPFPLSRPIKSSYEEQSRKGLRHNLDLSRKKWETPGFGNPRFSFSQHWGASSGKKVPCIKFLSGTSQGRVQGYPDAWVPGLWDILPKNFFFRLLFFFPTLDGPNRQSPIAGVQRTRSTLASHSAGPRGTNTKRMSANRTIRIAVQRTQGLRGPNAVF